MLYKKTPLLSLILLMCFAGAQARKAKLLEGSFDSLRGVKRMNVQFEYTAQTIGNDAIPDADYVRDHAAKVNDKTPGKGNTWALAWVGNRTRAFEPAFKTAFHDASKVTLTNNTMPQKYTLIFKTTNLEPGYNVGISRKNARVSGEAWIVESANPANVLCKLQVTDAPGGGGMGGFDFDNGARMKGAYVVAGNMLGKYLKKKV